MTSLNRYKGAHDALMRQKMRAQVRRLGKLPPRQLQQMAATLRDRAAQVLLNHPDPITRMKAEDRRNAELLKGVTGKRA
jgi:hypothetical protein